MPASNFPGDVDAFVTEADVDGKKLDGSDGFDHPTEHQQIGASIVAVQQYLNDAGPIPRPRSVFEVVDLLAAVTLTADGGTYNVACDGTQNTFAGSLPKSWFSADGRITEPGLYRVATEINVAAEPTTPDLSIKVQTPGGNNDYVAVDGLAAGTGEYQIADVFGITQADLDFYVANAGGFPQLLGQIIMPTDATFSVFVNVVFQQLMAY